MAVVSPMTGNTLGYNITYSVSTMTNLTSVQFIPQEASVEPMKNKVITYSVTTNLNLTSLVYIPFSTISTPNARNLQRRNFTVGRSK